MVEKGETEGVTEGGGYKKNIKYEQFSELDCIIDHTL
jgi:hypothetical protein